MDKYQVSLESFVNTIVPTGIVIHHTALVSTNRVPRGEKEVDDYHQQRGFEIYCDGRIFHVAYHYLISADGKVEKGRPDHCEGAHARGYNSYLGVSLLGDFSSRDNPGGAKGPERPTAAQMKALAELCQSLRQKYKIPLQHVLRHSDISSTDCPGDRFPFTAFLRTLQENESRSNVKQDHE
jgi:N-acetyl-anhydromuramyl-L-alanine amidase AmpD